MAGSNGEPFQLTGRVALVTGASRGIGLAVARELARAGAAVGLVARDMDRLGAASEALRDAGVRTCLVLADLAESGAAEHAASTCEAELGPIDILVNNAGLSSRATLEQLSDAEWRHLHQVNLDAAFVLCRSVVPGMCARRWGRVVNIASISAQTGGVRGSVAYASAKGALLSFTKALARDVGPAGVTVNAVAPGQIDTTMGSQLTPDQLAELTAQIPVGRLGRPEEVAYVVRFLASNEASYVTGATFDVNGGIARR